MKVKIFNRKMKKKLLVAYLLIIVAILFVVGHIFYINFAKGDEYGLLVLSQQDSRSITIPYKRGDIVDRNGNVLATSTKVYNLILDPKAMLGGKNNKTSEEKLNATLDALVTCFGLNREEVSARIHEKKDSRYLVCTKHLTHEQVTPFKEMMNDENSKITGVFFEDEYVRKYPYSNLAATLIGYTNSGDSGSWGIEEYYNDTLNGTDGRQFSYFNSENVMENIIKDAEDGRSIISSIDMNVQGIIEKKIASWKEQYHPENVAAIVADPNTGEILGMSCSKNNYDLNNPRDLTPFYTEEDLQQVLENELQRYTEEEQAALTEDDKQLIILNRVWRNYCISDSLEAGSTIKPFTVAAAIEEGAVSKDQTFVCDGAEAVADKVIHCHKRDGHGTVSLTQAIMQSCNDALMQISFKLGKDAFCKYQSQFGFGLKTGIDLPGEVSCASLIYTQDTMRDIDLATNSFGQNFNVTMIQMVAGFSALINGGNYYQPTVVKQIVNPDGTVVENMDKKLVKNIVTQDTTDFLKNALHETVVAGTGKSAAVPGYEVAGKTGTAQIAGRRGEDAYILSFMGYAPFDNPEVLCYVIVDEPDVPDRSSSSYASRLFSEIMTEVLPYMGVYSEIETIPETPQPEETTSEAVEDDNQQEQNEEEQPEENQETQNTPEEIGDESYDLPLYEGNIDELYKENE